MPYIKQEDRTKWDQILEEFQNRINLETRPENKVGELNYVITSLLYLAYPDKNYRAYNDIHGVLNCVDREFYRRFTGPYEDEKAKANGDLFTDR